MAEDRGKARDNRQPGRDVHVMLVQVRQVSPVGKYPLQKSNRNTAVPQTGPMMRQTLDAPMLPLP